MIRKEVLKVDEWKLNYVCEGNSSYNVFFSLKELKELQSYAVQSGAKTTPGQNKYNFEQLKHLHDIVLDEIFALFNYIWEVGYQQNGNMQY